MQIPKKLNILPQAQIWDDITKVAITINRIIDYLEHQKFPKLCDKIANNKIKEDQNINFWLYKMAMEEYLKTFLNKFDNWDELRESDIVMEWIIKKILLNK